MKKWISKILSKFLVKYIASYLIRDEDTVYLKFEDVTVLVPKDDKWHNISVVFNCKRPKQTKVYMDDVKIFNKKAR